MTAALIGAAPLLMIACSTAPVRERPPDHPDFGLCAWCVEMARAAPQCSLVEDCNRCRR